MKTDRNSDAERANIEDINMERERAKHGDRTNTPERPLHHHTRLTL